MVEGGRAEWGALTDRAREDAARVWMPDRRHDACLEAARAAQFPTGRTPSFLRWERAAESVRPLDAASCTAYSP